MECKPNGREGDRVSCSAGTVDGLPCGGTVHLWPGRLCARQYGCRQSPWTLVVQVVAMLVQDYMTISLSFFHFILVLLNFKTKNAETATAKKSIIRQLCPNLAFSQCTKGSRICNNNDHSLLSNARCSGHGVRNHS